jgi:hypothetical protein
MDSCAAIVLVVHDLFTSATRCLGLIRSMQRYLLILALMVTALGLPGLALADQIRVGAAAAVTETVTASLADEAPPHVVALGEDVFFNEKIITTTTSSAVVQFRDRSTLEIGPDATIVIDKAVFNPSESVSEKSITVVAGAFRFISGVASQHSDTTIRTPVGTLGIRGSVVVGEIAQQGDVVLFAVEGQGRFEHAGTVTVVPEGGVVVATFSNGKVETLPNVPASFSKIVHQLVAKLGASTPPLKGFSPAQQSWNAKFHTVPSGQQGAGQGSGSGPVAPLGGGGQSHVAALFNEIGGQKSGSGGNPCDVEFLSGFFGGQIRQREFNSLAGITGVTHELAGVLGTAEVITVATSFVAHNPRFAPQVALVLVGLYPGQGQAIINAFKTVLTPAELAAVTAALGGAGGNNSGADPLFNTPIPPNPLSISD